eukprot:5392262-Pyramimonas_sp.AAC.1
MVRKQLASVGMDTRTTSQLDLVSWAPPLAAVADAADAAPAGPAPAPAAAALPLADGDPRSAGDRARCRILQLWTACTDAGGDE